MLQVKASMIESVIKRKKIGCDRWNGYGYTLFDCIMLDTFMAMGFDGSRPFLLRFFGLDHKHTIRF